MSETMEFRPAKVYIGSVFHPPGYVLLLNHPRMLPCWDHRVELRIKTRFRIQAKSYHRFGTSFVHLKTQWVER